MATHRLRLIAGICLLTAVAAAFQKRRADRTEAPKTTATIPARLLGCAGSGG